MQDQDDDYACWTPIGGFQKEFKTKTIINSGSYRSTHDEIMIMAGEEIGKMFTRALAQGAEQFSEVKWINILNIDKSSREFNPDRDRGFFRLITIKKK